MKDAFDTLPEADAFDALPVQPQDAFNALPVQGSSEINNPPSAIQNSSPPSPAAPANTQPNADATQPQRNLPTVADQSGNQGAAAGVPFTLDSIMPNIPEIEAYAADEARQRQAAGETGPLDYRLAHGAPGFFNQFGRSFVRKLVDQISGLAAWNAANEANALPTERKDFNRQDYIEAARSVPKPDVAADGGAGKLIGEFAGGAVIPTAVTGPFGLSGAAGMGAFGAAATALDQASQLGLGQREHFSPIEAATAIAGGAAAGKVGSAIFGKLVGTEAEQIAAASLARKLTATAASLPAEAATFGAANLAGQSIETGELPTAKDAAGEMLQQMIALGVFKVPGALRLIGQHYAFKAQQTALEAAAAKAHAGDKVAQDTLATAVKQALEAEGLKPVDAETAAIIDELAGRTTGYTRAAGRARFEQEAQIPRTAATQQPAGTVRVEGAAPAVAPDPSVPADPSVPKQSAIQNPQSTIPPLEPVPVGTRNPFKAGPPPYALDAVQVFPSSPWVEGMAQQDAAAAGINMRPIRRGEAVDWRRHNGENGLAAPVPPGYTLEDVGGTPKSRRTQLTPAQLIAREANPPRITIAAYTPGTGQTTLIDFVADEGGISPKGSMARPGGEYDGSIAFGEAANFYRVIYGSAKGRGGNPPDVIAQRAYEAGLLPEPSPDLLWQKLRGEMASYRRWKAGGKADAATGAAIAEHEDAVAARKAEIAGSSAPKTTKDFLTTQADPPKRHQPVEADALTEGSRVKVDGEWLEVRRIDPDTYDLELKDGRRFGIQEVKAGTILYAEKVKLADHTTGGSDPFADILTPGADVTTAARQAGQRGAVSLPALDKLRARWRALVALFNPNRGVPKEIYDAYVTMRAAWDASTTAAYGARQTILETVQKLQGRYGRPAVMDATREVFDGQLTPQQWGQRFGLPQNHALVQQLQAMKTLNAQQSLELSKWSGLSPEAAEAIANNVHYQTRRYLRHILGDEFVPEPQRVQDAIHEVEIGLNDAVATVGRRASRLADQTPSTFDVGGYLATGDEALLAGLAPERQAEARALGRQYREVRALVDQLLVNGQTVTAAVNARAIRQAAQGIVDYHLGKEVAGTGGLGGLDISSLKRRHLEGAFRLLYGEVTDPAFRQALTVEAQGRLLAQQAFVNRVLAEGEGTAWDHRPDAARGFTKQLGDAHNVNDRRRFGDLAGKFVTPEFHDLVIGQQHSGRVYQAMRLLFFGPMAFQRVAKLQTPKTIARNYGTAISGFALGSGDIFLPTWIKHFTTAHKLMMDYARGKTGAIEELRQLASRNVFRPGTATTTFDLDAALGGIGGKIAQLGRKVTSAYAFLDFPAKYAAFKARVDAGMTPEQAARHVQDLYQNRDRIPGVISRITRVGMADYLGYTYDSARISVNQLRHAVTAIRRGDPRPLLGFAASRALWAASRTAAAATITASFAALHQRIRGDKDKNKGMDVLTENQQSALRRLLPDYDQNAPLLTWSETRKDGRRVLYYTVAGGQTAFPLEDALIGALQSTRHGQGFTDGLLHNLAQMGDEGMYFSAIKKAMTGADFSGNKTPTGKGLFDALPGHHEPNRSQIVQDALTGFGLDMTVSGLAQPLQQLYRMHQSEESGIDNKIGLFANTKTTEDVIAAAGRLVRTYRVEQTDFYRMVRNQAQAFSEPMRSAQAMLNRAVVEKVTKGGVLPQQAATAEVGRNAVLGYKRDLAALVRDARRLAPDWYGAQQHVMVMDAAGIGTQDAIDIWNLANIEERREQGKPVQPLDESKLAPASPLRLKPWQVMRLNK